MLKEVPCESCAGIATFATELPPFGSDPGHRLYMCASCKRYTWATWRLEPQSRHRRVRLRANIRIGSGVSHAGNCGGSVAV